MQKNRSSKVVHVKHGPTGYRLTFPPGAPSSSLESKTYRHCHLTREASFRRLNGYPSSCPAAARAAGQAPPRHPRSARSAGFAWPACTAGPGACSGTRHPRTEALRGLWHGEARRGLSQEQVSRGWPAGNSASTFYTILREIFACMGCACSFLCLHCTRIPIRSCWVLGAEPLQGVHGSAAHQLAQEAP